MQQGKQQQAFKQPWCITATAPIGATEQPQLVNSKTRAIPSSSAHAINLNFKFKPPKPRPSSALAAACTASTEQHGKQHQVVCAHL
jgi:hypothetical protein